jgi:hypothetical protein
MWRRLYATATCVGRLALLPEVYPSGEASSRWKARRQPGQGGSQATRTRAMARRAVMKESAK